MRKCKIFFSYTLKDLEMNLDVLMKVKEKFEQFENVSTYFDILDNNSVNHQDRVYEELMSSNMLCLLRSPGIEKSSWVGKELQFARENHMKIVELGAKDIEYIVGSRTRQEMLSNLKVKEMLIE